MKFLFEAFKKVFKRPNLTLWKPLHKVDFFDKNILQYNCDTRDFLINESKEPAKLDLSFIKPKYEERFYYTPLEIHFLMKRLYEESGGKGRWRLLTLTGDGAAATTNWQLKYIRIYRVEKGFVVADMYGKFLRKDLFNNPVNQEYLSLDKYKE